MVLIQFLPLIIMLLLVVATISLFVFWLGRPTRKKLRMAKLSLGYLFLLNAVLALTVNIMLIKDPQAVDAGPLSLLMLLVPLAVGALLFRGGCDRYAQMSLEEALQFDGGQAQSEQKKLTGKRGKGGKWKVLDDKQGEAVLHELRQSVPSGTWALILLLVSALAYAPAIFMLQGGDQSISPETPQSREGEPAPAVTPPVSVTAPESSPAHSPTSPTDLPTASPSSAPVAVPASEPSSAPRPPAAVSSASGSASSSASAPALPTAPDLAAGPTSGSMPGSLPGPATTPEPAHNDTSAPLGG